ncbi:MAG: 2OG-Fe(II) oxygenase family protein [Myxococcota bacterium]|nr:2OG-Fe(II) oxygenase family protein [Myxococcota bacterium]
MIEPSLAISPFPTPIWVFDLPEMEAINAALATSLLAEAARVPSVQRSNIGGWHSAPDLSRRSDPMIQRLMQTIIDQVDAGIGGFAAGVGVTELPRFRYALTAWAMIMRDGDYVVPHDHGDAHWSSAYYVDAGEPGPAPAGRLAFLDPRRSVRAIPGLPLFPSVFDIAPRTGSLVIFPAWLQHHVYPYRGGRPRICISCNVTVDVADPR